MAKITIAEFQSATGLSDSAIMWLIRRNELPFDYSKERGLLIDAENVGTKEIVAALISKGQSALEKERSLIMERLSVIVAEQLDRILNDALD